MNFLLQVVASNKLEPLLGVFQKLVASKLNDHEGFYLIQSLLEYLPVEVVANYVKSIFTLVIFLLLENFFFQISTLLLKPEPSPTN
jgi:hypothetical protein